jgi:hypothetical protein
MRYFRLFSQKGSFESLSASAKRAGFDVIYEHALDKVAVFRWSEGDPTSRHAEYAITTGLNQQRCDRRAISDKVTIIGAVGQRYPSSVHGLSRD